MKILQHSFSQVKKTEEFSSFIIRLILGSVACFICGLGIFFDVLQMSLQNYLVISFFFYCFTFAFFLSLFHTLKSDIRRYLTLFIDISFPSLTIYFTAAETQVIWLLYVWVYIGYGSRYGKRYLFVAQIITLFQYNIVLYYSNAWTTNNPLDLVTHLFVLATLPLYILSMIKRIHLAKTEAIKVGKLKSQFLASMSHEIRTPLNGIIGTSHLLSKTSLDSQQQKYSKALLYSSEILLSLINDILDFSKIDANKIELDKNEISIQHCVELVIQTLLFNAHQKNLKLNYHIHKNVPDILVGDEKRLKQILLNLVVNAIKFTEKGFIDIDISNITAVSENYNAEKLANQCVLLFKVKDTGIGISKQDQEIIFEHFTQVGKTTSLPNSGTGLGTAISKELVKIMGGKISLKSELGKGSEFCFTIIFDCPVKADNIEKSAIDKSEILMKTEINLRILIAEDDDINAMILNQFLIEQGHVVNRVKNGQEALELLKSHQFDLIFMDLHMPKLSGLETTREIRKHNQSLVIMGLTANATTEQKEICLHAGMDTFLSKPITPNALQEAISKSFTTQR
jgi:two-component system, sensor histidine kinase